MRWTVQRLLQGIVTIWAVMTVSFALVRLLPGNPVDFLIVDLVQQGVEPAEAAQRAQNMLNIDPTKPLHIAYFEYMFDVLQGNLGQSTWYSEPVTAVIGRALPWTILVMSYGVLLSFLLGIVGGAFMAYFEGQKLDLALTSYATFMISVPYYVLAIILLVFLGYRFGLFPASGRVPTGVTPGVNLPYIAGVLHHAALPILSQVVITGGIALQMRGNSIRVLGEDYLRVARLRGLSDYLIATRYVGRNAVLPIYTGLMISIGAMFGGAVVLETIFKYRGMGYYLVRAVQTRDFPLMMGAFTVIAVAVVIALLVADITYGRLDPRAGRGEV